MSAPHADVTATDGLSSAELQLLRKREERGKTALHVTRGEQNKNRYHWGFFFLVAGSLSDDKVRGSKRHRGAAPPLMLGADDGPVTRTRALQRESLLLIISTDR